MAKDKSNGRFWLKFLVTVSVLLFGFAVGYGMLSQKVEDNTSHIETTKKEGCLPARESKIQIQLLQKDVKTILKKQDKSDIKQETMDGKLDELLRR